jgi:hypothetical protein
MASSPHLPRGRASLEVLRAEAADELSTVVHERLLAGEDPWDFMEQLPTVDELVVYLLRADSIAEDGGRRPGEARDYRVLRQIALEHPQLTPTVWRLIGTVTGEGAGSRASRPAGSGEPGVNNRKAR